MKKKRLSTMVELVQELEKLPRTPAIQEILDEAMAGEYHDYKNNKYACGKVESSRKLRAAGLVDLAKRIENGDFDEEADAEDEVMLAGLVKELTQPQKSRPRITPRIRGKAVRVGDRWGWEIMITMEPDKTIANLPSVDAELVEISQSIDLKSPETFKEKEQALRDLEIHAPRVFELMTEAIGLKGAAMMNPKTMEVGTKFQNGRLIP